MAGDFFIINGGENAARGALDDAVFGIVNIDSECGKTKGTTPLICMEVAAIATATVKTHGKKGEGEGGDVKAVAELDRVLAKTKDNSTAAEHGDGTIVGGEDIMILEGNVFHKERSLGKHIRSGARVDT